MQKEQQNISDDIIKGFLLGFIKIHILYHASQEPIYGKEFQEELQRHGYQLSFGTLYPIFHKLEKNGYLKVEKKVANGRARKYYRITEKGKSALQEAKSKARELIEEIDT